MTDSGDPPRLVDPASPASPRLRELIEESRADVGTEPEIRKLEAALGPALWPGGAGPGAVKAAATKGGVATALKIVAGAAIVAGAGTVWLATMHDRSSPTRGAAARSAEEARPAVATPALAPAPAAEPSSAPTIETGSATEAPSSVAAPRVPSASGAPPSTRRSAADSVSEADLLGQAQAALSSDPARALSLCEQHQRLFSHGLLGQEREVIAVEALARLGRTADAKTKGERFLRAFPTSAHRSKIESIIGVR